MGKLMKYEFRKTRMTRLIMIFLAVISQILYLSGLFLKWDSGSLWGTILLIIIGTFGIIYIGIESILILSKDINTKQSYMLFMTPKNSFQILGAKVLVNMISMIAAGIIFALMLTADAHIAMLKLHGLNAFLDNLNLILNTMFDNLPTWQEFTFTAVSFLLNWFMTITIGYLAVVLSATILAGKRFNGIISFILFILISWASAFILETVPLPSTQTAAYLLETGLILLFSAGFYFLSGWILERRMSL